MCRVPEFALAVALCLLALPYPVAADVGSSAHAVCGDCHLAPGGTTPAGAPATGAAGASCAGCHRDQEVTRFATHACTDCHADHPNDQPAQLRNADERPATGDLDRTTRLCLSCHEQAGKIEGANGHFIRHPVGITARQAEEEGARLPLFDVRGTADAGDDVIGCLTCHMPHANGIPRQVRWVADDEAEACSSCHDLDTPPDPLFVFRRR